MFFKFMFTKEIEKVRKLMKLYGLLYQNTLMENKF